MTTMTSPQHLPTDTWLNSLQAFTRDDPMRVVMSGCLFGTACAYDGSGFGGYPPIAGLLALPNLHVVHCCPEDHSFGTPRDLSNIYDGNGFDVLDGRARVLTDDGDDWTDGTIAGAEAMLEIARRNDVHLAILLDISAACGSQVIYDGRRDASKYQRGPGVAAALLIRNGYRVLSQRDFRTLRLLYHKLGAEPPPGMPDLDHHESAWYLEYFGGDRS